jgi:RimJ/RimL family protein N-acetyltransferase
VITTQFADSKHNPAFNEAVGHFVSELVYGERGRFRDFCSLAVCDAGFVIAGVLYHHFYPRSGVMELSAAAVDKRWLTRPVLRAMFEIPFDVFGCQLVVLRVSERNTSMLRIARAYGFTEYVIPRLLGRDEAEHILTLGDDEWRASRFNRGK